MTGAVAVFPWSSTLANIGVSRIFSRITRPTATRIRLARKGTRQPHESNVSSDIVADSSVIPPVPSTNPTGTPIWAKLPSRPRLLLVTPFHREQHRAAPLAADRDALQHAQSHEQQRRGDADGCGPGQDADDGRGEMPITSSVMISVVLRPIRSPQCPKIAAPIGRAANPTK